MLVILGVWIFYWPITYVLPKAVFLEMLNGMLSAVSIGIVLAYFPGAWRSLRARPYALQGAHLLVLGVTLMQLAITGLFIWGWAYRILDKPYWMTDSMLRGWFVYLLFIANVLLLMATDVDNDAMPTRSWLHVGSFVAIGLGMSVILLLFFSSVT